MSQIPVPDRLQLQSRSEAQRSSQYILTHIFLSYFPQKRQLHVSIYVLSGKKQNKTIQDCKKKKKYLFTGFDCHRASEEAFRGLLGFFLIKLTLLQYIQKKKSPLKIFCFSVIVFFSFEHRPIGKNETKQIPDSLVAT